MEFINYTRRDVSSAGAASVDIKKVKSLLDLKLNLGDGKKEITFSGLGSYLEVDVQHEGASKKVKIPFFSAYKKDKFVNTNGYAYVSPLAKKVIDKIIKRNVPTFDLGDFQAATTAELDERISALGTSSAEINLKNQLENRRDNIIATAQKKDSDKLVREEIKYLEDVIKSGLNLSVCSNDAARKAAITKYCNQFERLETLKAQLKTLTWSQKRGIRKLNNKHFKRITAGVAAVAVAAGLAVGQVFEFPKRAWERVENFFASKPKQTQTVNPTQTPTITAAPVRENVTINTYTAAPNLTATPVIPTASDTVKYNLESQMFAEASELNYANFIAYKSEADALMAYGYDYNSLILGYTFVEHSHELDLSGISQRDIDNHINNARVLISMILRTGQYNQLPLRQETFDTMQDCFNGNAEAGIAFVGACCESHEPLLDMITIGELESNMLGGQQLLNFNTNVYFNEINEYKTKISNGTLEIASIEPSKVKTLGNYPRA